MRYTQVFATCLAIAACPLLAALVGQEDVYACYQCDYRPVVGYSCISGYFSGSDYCDNGSEDRFCVQRGNCILWVFDTLPVPGGNPSDLDRDKPIDDVAAHPQFLRTRWVCAVWEDAPAATPLQESPGETALEQLAG